MDSQDPVTVFNTPNPVEADLIKNLLQTEGIRCVLEGHDQNFLPGSMAIPIHIMVEAANADRARKLIESHGERHRQPSPSQDA